MRTYSETCHCRFNYLIIIIFTCVYFINVYCNKILLRLFKIYVPYLKFIDTKHFFLVQFLIFYNLTLFVLLLIYLYQVKIKLLYFIFADL